MRSDGRSGAPMLRSLTVLGDQSINPTLSETIRELKGRVEDGEPIGDAIKSAHRCSGSFRKITSRSALKQVRRSLLHWRYRTLRRSFVQLVSAVYASKLAPENRPTGR